MSDSYFELTSQTPDSCVVLPTRHTVGPWSPELQHGGPPSALTVAVADRAVRNATGRGDLSPRRVAVDFVGAVPVAPLEVAARLVRTARSAALAEVSITAGGRLCLASRVWFIRDTDTTGLVTSSPAPPAVPDGGGGDAMGLDFGYGRSIEWRYVSGAMTTAGPAAVWARSRLPLLPDWPQTDLGRVALVADSASGVSAELDWSEWSFVNVDLDIHLAAPLRGDWVLLDAVTQVGPAGSAVARSTISGAGGVVGAGLQTLVLSRLPTR